jgi:hypothetical protein
MDSRSFTNFLFPYPVIYFLFAYNYLLIWKMFTETLLRIPFSVIGLVDVLKFRPLIGSRENAQEIN